MAEWCLVGQDSTEEVVYLTDEQLLADTAQEVQDDQDVQGVQEMPDMQDSAQSQAKELQEVKSEIIRQDSLIAHTFGFNKEKLYQEVLNELVNPANCQERYVEPINLIRYLKEVFGMDDEKHNQFYERARHMKKTPNPISLLNVNILEAKNLTPKDSNGLSDPFCLIYLSSNLQKKCRTEVKFKTLSPVWGEHFCLHVDSPCNDSLIIEVWDFDPKEKVKDAIKRISDTNGLYGFFKLAEEIIIAACSNEDHNEYIGKAVIHLKDLFVGGNSITMDVTTANLRVQGTITVKVTLSQEKCRKVAAQEFRHLLRIFTLSELDLKEENKCIGWFSDAADRILQQHIAQSGMTEREKALSQWVVYASFNNLHKVRCNFLYSMLQKLLGPITDKKLEEDETRLFWDAAKKVLPLCCETIRTLWKLLRAKDLTENHPRDYIHLNDTLSILGALDLLEFPEGLNLFEYDDYKWLKQPTTYNIRTVVKEAIEQSTTAWYIDLHEFVNAEAGSSEDEAQIVDKKCRIVRLITDNLQKSFDFHEKLFVTEMKMSYVRTMYPILEREVCKMKESVECICKKMESTRSSKNNQESETIGRNLFRLYLKVQKMADEAGRIGIENLQITKYYTWFHQAVNSWLVYARVRSKHHIKQDVKKDTLIPDTPSTKHSSSAKDTLGTFRERIKLFWEQLAWPDIKESYAYGTQAVVVLCECATYYADMMVSKVETIEYKNGNSMFTSAWCVAVNNIDHVTQQLQPFVSDLGLDKTIEDLSKLENSDPDHYRKNLQKCVNINVDEINRKASTLLKTYVEKVFPELGSLLSDIESEHRHVKLSEQHNSLYRLCEHLKDHLKAANSLLSPSNYSKILKLVHKKLVDKIDSLYHTGRNNRPSFFFANLNEALSELKIILWEDGDKENEKEARFQQTLSLHGMTTKELITEVHKVRLEEQNKMEGIPLGQLTVVPWVSQNTLHIEVLNARNLIPKDGNGYSDPYVTIHLLPEDVFVHIKKPKTKAQKTTLFPLFDETFSIQLTKEQIMIKDGKLLFMVKDQDMGGFSSNFLGEAYLPFSEIPESTEKVTEQTHLKLNVPSQSCLKCEAMGILSLRQKDKLAKEFLKMQKAKHDHGSVS